MIGNDDDDNVDPYLFTWNTLLNVEIKNFKLQDNYNPIHKIIFVIFCIYICVNVYKHILKKRIYSEM